MDALATINTPTDDFGTVQRLRTLAPGVYWRAKKQVEWKHGCETHDFSCPKGDVLLLINLECVDGQIHTIILRDHPSRGDGTLRILIDTFLDHFEYEPDGERIRAQELAAIQGKVAELQHELTRVQSDPALLTAASEEYRKRKPSQAALPAPSLTTTNVSEALSLKITDADVAAIRLMAEDAADAAQAQAKWLTAATTEISETIAAMAPFFAEKSAAVLAGVQGVMDYARNITKGLESLDLYTGKGVVVETICEGEPAPAGEPLAIMQRKLMVDEELAVWADVGSDFDFESLPTFDENLAGCPSLRDQIFPTARCVVAMAVRRRDLDYGNGFANRQLNEMNRRVFLLVRNGENIHRVYSCQPTHERAERLFPTRDEHDEIFKGEHGEAINFEDIRYADKEASSKNLALHYKRLLILLCGLDHRLKLFGDFYDPNSAPMFISREFQERFFRFIADDETGSMLGDGRPAFHDWVLSVNAFAQSGSRVFSYYNLVIDPDTAPACERYTARSSYDRTEVYARPINSEGIDVLYREGKDLFIKVKVERCNGDVSRPEFDAKVNMSKALRHAGGIHTLCLDTVTPEDLLYYVHDRQARVESVNYIRLFKRLAKLLSEERAEEHETREYLRDALSQGNVASEASAGSLINDTVRAWRCAHRGSPLAKVTEKSEMAALLDRLFALANSTNDLDRAIGYAEQHGLELLRVSVSGRNRVVIYATVPEGERDCRLVKWGWVQRIGLERRKRCLSEVSRRLVWLVKREDATETSLRDWPDLSQWINEEAEPFQPTAPARMLQAAKDRLAVMIPDLLGNPNGLVENSLENLMRSWRQALLSGNKNRVLDLYVSFPLGIAYRKPGRYREGGLCYVFVQEYAATWFKHFANDSQRPKVRETYAGVYNRKDLARTRFDENAFTPRIVLGEEWQRAHFTGWRSAHDLLLPEGYERHQVCPFPEHLTFLRTGVAGDVLSQIVFLEDDDIREVVERHGGTLSKSAPENISSDE